MTDKEKKATDDLFSLTHINGYINLYDQKKANIYTSDLKRWQNGVKVLLNLIETQQEEIEKRNRQLEERTNRIRKLEKSCQNYFDTLMEVIEQKNEKNLIIREMAKYISSLDIDEDICKKVDNPCKDNAGDNKKTCDDCIKEYFINKIKKESKE